MNFRLIGMAAVALAGLTAFAQQDGWSRLDNGKDFTNWKIGGEKSSWTIQDGAFVSHGPVSHLLYDGPLNGHKFQNFELKGGREDRAQLKRGRLLRHRVSG